VRYRGAACKQIAASKGATVDNRAFDEEWLVAESVLRTSDML
jgi:hypothetical protein